MNPGLLFELARRDFTERYAGSILGILWMFLWPLVMIAIYTLVFSRVMGAKLPGISSVYSYSIYLIAGILPWTAFANTVSRSSTVFVDKRHLLTKLQIFLPRLPLYVVLSETVTFGVSLAFYLLFLLFAGAGISWRALFFVPFVFAVQQIFAYALGFFFAVLNVFIRDLREFVGILIQVWFWMTPIVYMKSLVPEFAQSLLLWNPAVLFIEAYQDIFFFQRLPDFRSLLVLTLLGHLLLALAYFIFKRLEKDVRDFL